MATDKEQEDIMALLDRATSKQGESYEDFMAQFSMLPRAGFTMFPNAMDGTPPTGGAGGKENKGKDGEAGQADDIKAALAKLVEDPSSTPAPPPDILQREWELAATVTEPSIDDDSDSDGERTPGGSRKIRTNVDDMGIEIEELRKGTTGFFLESPRAPKLDNFVDPDDISDLESEMGEWVDVGGEEEANEKDAGAPPAPPTPPQVGSSSGEGGTGAGGGEEEAVEQVGEPVSYEEMLIPPKPDPRLAELLAPASPPRAAPAVPPPPVFVGGGVEEVVDEGVAGVLGEAPGHWEAQEGGFPGAPMTAGEGAEAAERAPAGEPDAEAADVPSPSPKKLARPLAGPPSPASGSAAAVTKGPGDAAGGEDGGKAEEGAGAEAEESAVEAFALDPDFDYDHIPELTPKFWPFHRRSKPEEEYREGGWDGRPGPVPAETEQEWLAREKKEVVINVDDDDLGGDEDAGAAAGEGAGAAGK